MAHDLLQPLLPHERSHPASCRVLGVVEADAEITVASSEIRESAFTARSAELDVPIIPQGDGGRDSSNRLGAFHRFHNSVRIPEEEELREIIRNRYEIFCCWRWRQRSTSEWRIMRVDDCSSYVGMLETFIEERNVIDEVEPYAGGIVDGQENGRLPDPWEVDMKSEMPLLFVSEKEARKRIPHSEVINACEDCSGTGRLPSCNCETKLHLKHTAAVECRLCHQPHTLTNGTSVPICNGCKSEKMVFCPHCGAERVLICTNCRGYGTFIHGKLLLVNWRTIKLRRVCGTENAASVPDEVFHRARGVELYEMQSYQCEPAYFEKSKCLTKFSEFVIAERASVPIKARVICERHILGMVPVTRIVMARKNKTLNFYIAGMSREIISEDNPANSHCGFSLCGLVRLNK